jgi:hypothetical protein
LPQALDQDDALLTIRATDRRIALVKKIRSSIRPVYHFARRTWLQRYRLKPKCCSNSTFWTGWPAKGGQGVPMHSWAATLLLIPLLRHRA